MKKIVMSLMLLTASFIMSAQVTTPQASPSGEIDQMVGLTEIEIEYSRPSMREREIFGGLVPYDKMWRTGANKNTTIEVSDDVTINGENLPAGKYAIYTIPQEQNWEVIFYKDNENWGLPKEWDEAKVALKTEAAVYQMPMGMQTFTIVIDDLTNNSAMLSFLWENTIAALKIEVPTEEKALNSIETTLAQDPKPADYYAAANYYYEEKKDMNQALAWMNKAVEGYGKDTPFYILRKKALIQAELGMKKEAIKTAKESLEGAKKAGNDDYIKMNEASIKAWSK
ncbi:DUF2911 domain-containing protein [Mesonia sp. K7]|uniref:DUF2911 domain-containing protein n=1 Tax=Mesonia sp. K7 TaxID=2218606 RepID=UPI000DA96F40|nr:DUF2911 domain-containing protein [Mesonia sp. K7]PZD79359.1 dihydrolipoamide dehydrogenase [Mesonia sp. K7]